MKPESRTDRGLAACPVGGFRLGMLLTLASSVLVAIEASVLVLGP